MRIRVTAIAALLTVLVNLASAHPIDEANLYHFFTCDLTERSAAIDYKLLVGGLSVFRMWDEMDTDHNKVISDSEKQAFIATVQASLHAWMDGKPISVTITSSTLPGYEDFIAGNAPYLEFALDLKWDPLPPRRHSLVLTSSSFPTLTSLFPKPSVNAPEAMAAQAPLIKDQRGFTITFDSGAAGPRLVPPTLTEFQSPAPATIGALMEPAIRAVMRDAQRRSMSITRGSYGQIALPMPVSISLLSRYYTKPLGSDKLIGTLGAHQPGLSMSPGGNREPQPLAASSLSLLPIPSRALTLRPAYPASVTATAFHTLSPNAATSSFARPSRAILSLRPFLLGSGGILAALCLSLLWGAIHALLPGHSKAVVAAYLVGSNGVSSDALFLGGVVTVAHTGSVLLLGAMMIGFEKLSPERIQPWIEAGSGLLIAIMGLSMVLRGLTRRSQVSDASELPIAESEADFTHARTGADRSRRSLLALGLAGGIVPCGDALILLLFANAEHRLPLGLLMVAAFGVGMAATLTAVGIAVVKSRKLFAALSGDRLTKTVGSLPTISGAFIMAAGIYAAVQALR